MNIDPDFYGRKVRHTHIDSREVGIIRGVFAEKVVRPDKQDQLFVILMVEIKEPLKRFGQIGLWHLEECEMEV
jgi:hypothetical protein